MKKLIEKTARIIEIALIFGVVGIYFSFFCGILYESKWLLMSGIISVPLLGALITINKIYFKEG